MSPDAEDDDDDLTAPDSNPENEPCLASSEEHACNDGLVMPGNLAQVSTAVEKVVFWASSMHNLVSNSVLW